MINNRLKGLIMEALEEVMDECGMNGDCAAPAAPIAEEEIPTDDSAPIEEGCKEDCFCNEQSLQNAKNLMGRMGCNINESKKSGKSLMMEHYHNSHRG